MDRKKKQPPKWWLRYEEMYVLKGGYSSSGS